MAKFLNKKEQVIDFQLTDYGHYLLSVGKLKPVYYAFFDDNIIYDINYTQGGGINAYGVSNPAESQNEIHQRIKEQTPYIETLTLRGNVDKRTLGVQQDAQGQYFFESDITPIMREPDTQNLKFTSMIGDAALDGNAQSAPAWKLIALEGKIASTAQVDPINSIRIPQVNVELNYTKKIIPGSDIDIFPDNVRGLGDTVSGFVDGNAIRLVMDDALIYCEEVNTELFTENFDIEVFQITSSTAGPGTVPGGNEDVFIRKYFEKLKPQIVNNLLISEKPQQRSPQDLTTDSVEYYFDILTDYEIEQKTACRGAEVFNKSSYYVDLDFECEDMQEDDFVFIDIYGRITESEICPT
tara:strand:+ start:46761 stop:47819 length:1059 start_codon:yes stop_codon:yes gene_type:complete